MSMMADNGMAMQLLKQCQNCGIFSSDYNEDILDLNLIECGLFDSMSLTMLAAMVTKYYGISIMPSQFVAELHSINNLAEYLENKI